MNENNIEIPNVKDRMEFSKRLELQLLIIKIKFPGDEKAQTEWLLQNSKEIGKIIDNPNSHVRFLIDEIKENPGEAEKRMEQAAKEVIAILNSKNGPDNKDQTHLAMAA